MATSTDRRFIDALLAPLPEGEGFDAQAFLDRCATDERVTNPRVDWEAFATDWLGVYASRNPSFRWPR